MLPVALLASLVLYSVVASQPLFYLVALGAAQRALSAPAYVELRQRINPLMARRVSAIYGTALLALIALLFLSAREGAGLLTIAAAVAVACLVVDAFLMVRVSVPINARIDGWTVAEHPPDWQEHRARWFAIFAYRQIALLAGFASLLAGAALH
jgi:hypothetical protein